ncbi:MAG: prephenate dehydrogenase [Anaerolineales bacterium]|nr:prephenate dehydrogenase [Anaerolineales bacterium]
MAVQITIIGLGQTGASIGLALAAHKDKVFVTGHDKDYGAEGRAKKLGAVDATNHNLPSSVENADLIILAIPVHQIYDTLKYIAQDIKNDAVLIELSPVKAEVAKWAKEILPAHCHYVGLVPAIGPGYLDKIETPQDAPQADLFTRSVFLLSAPTGTPGEAIKLASDFVKLLGANTLLTDFVESDGLISSAYLLPQLVSASLLDSTINQPGWQEAQKVAGRAYFAASSAFSETDDAETLTSLSFQNRENLIRALEQMIRSLVNLRDELENKDEESFKALLKTVQQGRSDWMNERIKGEWGAIKEEKVGRVSLTETLLGSALSKRFKPNKDEK